MRVTTSIDSADVIFVLKRLFRKRPKIVRKAEAQGVPIHLLRDETEEEVVRVVERMIR